MNRIVRSVSLALSLLAATLVAAAAAPAQAHQAADPGRRDGADVL